MIEQKNALAEGHRKTPMDLNETFRAQSEERHAWLNLIVETEAWESSRPIFTAVPDILLQSCENSDIFKGKSFKYRRILAGFAAFVACISSAIKAQFGCGLHACSHVIRSQRSEYYASINLFTFCCAWRSFPVATVNWLWTLISDKANLVFGFDYPWNGYDSNHETGILHDVCGTSSFVRAESVLRVGKPASYRQFLRIYSSLPILHLRNVEPIRQKLYKKRLFCLKCPIRLRYPFKGTVWKFWQNWRDLHTWPSVEVFKGCWLSTCKSLIYKCKFKKLTY